MDGIKFINDKLHIPTDIWKNWFVKNPTRAHRLSKGGTIGFDRVDFLDIQHNTEKLGLLVLDMTTKSYVKVPMEILSKYEPSEHETAGVKNAMIVFDLKRIVKEHKLKSVKIDEANPLADEKEFIKEASKYWHKG